MNRKAAGMYAAVELSTDVSDATPHQLILMLYDGAIQSISMARGHLAAKRMAEKGRAISKSMSIIEEGLRLALDKSVGGEIAQQLDELYTWMTFRLFFANAHNDDGKLEEVVNLLVTLRAAWAQIDEPARKRPAFEVAAQQSGKAANGAPAAKTWGHA